MVSQQGAWLSCARLLYDVWCVCCPTAAGPPPLQVIAKGAREHACALNMTGAAICWGHNEFAQLGRGPAPTAAAYMNVAVLLEAVAVPFDRPFVKLWAGPGRTCGQTAEGETYCW